MNISIKESIIEKIKNDDVDTIISTIDYSVVDNDEVLLPGLGVMLELFWDDLTINEKNNIAKIIKRKIS